MSPERPLRSLRGCHWFLTGVSGVVLNTKVLDMSWGISLQSFKSLAVSEECSLLSVSRASSKESKRTSLVIDWCQILRKVPDMLRRISVQILKSWASRERGWGSISKRGTDRHTDTHTDTHTHTQNLWNLEVLAHLKNGKNQSLWLFWFSWFLD